jgi:hypothetical protein
MTLIVGMMCGDHVLLAADSCSYDDETLEKELKVKLRYSGSLAWGYSGPELQGERFSDWMTEQAPALAKLSWEKAVPLIRRKVDELNAPAVAKYRRSPDRVRSYEFLHAIVGGFIGKSGSVVGINLLPEVPPFIESAVGKYIPAPLDQGALQGVAQVFQGFAQRRTLSADQECLEAFMEAAIDFLPANEWWLLKPVRVIRVSPKGSEDVSGAEYKRVHPAADQGFSAAAK